MHTPPKIKVLSAVICFLLLSSTQIFSQQTFVKSYGQSGSEQQAYSVNALTNGGVIIGGNRITGSISEALVIELDANGDVQWKRTYRIGGHAAVYCIKPKSAGGFIAVGMVADSADIAAVNNSRKTFALSIKADRTLEWLKIYDSPGIDDFGLRVLEVDPEHFIISGRRAHTNTKSYGFTIDIDGNGTVIGRRYIKGNAASDVNTFFGEVIQADNGDYIATGFITATASAQGHDNDAIAIRFTPDGPGGAISSAAMSKRVQFYSPDNQGSYGIARVAGGLGFFTSGIVHYNNNNNDFGLYFMRLKSSPLDPENDLNTEAVTAYRDNSNPRHNVRSNIIKEAGVDKNNIQVYISPITDESSGLHKKAGLTLVKVDTGVTWSHFYSFSGKDAYSTDACQTADGGYVTVGKTNAFSSGTDQDVLVIKTDHLGQVASGCFEVENDVLASPAKQWTKQDFDVVTTPTPWATPDPLFYEGDVEVTKRLCPNFCGCEKTTNLIANGDFENGNTGFSSGFTVMTSLFLPGTYAIGTYSSNLFCDNWHISNASCATDGHYLVVNGLTGLTGTRNVWSGNVQLETGKDYKLCMSLKNLPQCCFDVKPQVSISYNDGTQQRVLGPITVNENNTACTWLSYKDNLTIPANASATITVPINIALNQAGQGDGNDLAIDDISLIKLHPLPASLTDFTYSPPVPDANNNYNITATTLPLPPDCGYYWEVMEIDTNGNAIPPTVAANPLAWWVAPQTTTNFPGYNGHSNVPTNSTAAGIFNARRRYRIARGTWCNCNSWGSVAHIFETQRNRIVITRDTKYRLAPPAKLAFPVKLAPPVKQR